MYVQTYGDEDEIEIRFFEPITVEVLSAAFGTFHDYVIDDREDPEYTSDEVKAPGPFEVTLTINSHGESWNQIMKDRVKVVYLRRRSHEKAH